MLAHGCTYCFGRRCRQKSAIIGLVFLCLFIPTNKHSNQQHMERCLIPSEYCGATSRPMPTVNKKENLRYTGRGTPLSCMKKGIGVGLYMEHKAGLPTLSLQHIKYIGDVYEQQFARSRIRNIPQLFQYIQTHTRRQNEAMLRTVLTNAMDTVDIRAYNSVIHFLYMSNETPRAKLPACTPIV